MSDLKRHVALFDDKGELHQFGPDSGSLPAWARKRITNPNVWDEPPADEGDSGSDGPPPQSGRGSSEKAWAAYAQAHGVDAEGKDREEIIAACREAGVPVE